MVRQSPERLVAGGACDAFPFRSPLAAPMPCMKITRGRGVAEQVARARRVARSKHDGATSGKRAACFGLSLKRGRKRAPPEESDDVPDAENPEEIEDALPAPPVPPSPLGSAATHQDRELEALAESIKRMYAGYVNEFVKEVQ